MQVQNAMDPVAIATALISAQVARLQLAAAAKLAQMDAGQAQSVTKLLEAARANMDRLANVAVGIGAGLDVSA